MNKAIQETRKIADAINQSCKRAYAKGYAEGIMRPKEFEVVADYCKLALYSHDYHLLLTKWLIAKDIAIADIEVEIYATYCVVNERIIPYDVQYVGTESEQLVAWI